MLCHSGYSHCLPQSVHIMLINCPILFHPASARSAVRTLRDRQRMTLNIVTQLDRTICGVLFETLRQSQFFSYSISTFNSRCMFTAAQSTTVFALKVAGEGVE